jgi:hypothetical protein
VAKHGSPDWVGKGFFGLEAETVARHNPANPLDVAGLDQARRGDDREEGLAAARGHGSENVSDLCRFTACDCSHKACKSLLMRPQGPLRRRGHMDGSGGKSPASSMGRFRQTVNPVANFVREEQVAGGRALDGDD